MSLGVILMSWMSLGVRQSGVDVRGYYHWSLLDNFEWVKGFEPRFGLFKVDYTNFERTATRSARLYQEIIAQHRALGGLAQNLGDLEGFLEGLSTGA